MKAFIIDGNNFNNLEGFHDEAQRKLCPSFKGFGRNLAAFDDILWGGFLTFDYSLMHSTKLMSITKEI